MPQQRPILIDVPDELVGARIVARPFADGDAAALREAIMTSITHIQPWLPWYNSHQSIDDTRAYIRHCQAHWITRDEFSMGVFERVDGGFLGGIGLHAHDWDTPAFEIGYWLRQSAEGHGYMSEAARLVTALAFDALRAQRVVIQCDARNLRSAAVARRLGYMHEGRLRRTMRDTSGDLRDTLIFALVREDYEQVCPAWPADTTRAHDHRRVAQ